MFVRPIYASLNVGPPREGGPNFCRWRVFANATVLLMMTWQSKFSGPRDCCRGISRSLPACRTSIFNPHSFGNTFVRPGQDLCKSPEAFKAWSQNLGHETVLTTFT